MEPGNKFEKKTIGAFGYNLTYAEAGKGDVIISIPGSAGIEMSTAKDILAEDFRVIEINPPGWSNDPQTPGLMRQRQIAIIIAEAITELGVDTFHLLGTSMGGGCAFWLTALYPDRVKSISLEAPMLFGRDEDMVNPQGKKMIEALVNGAPAPDVSAYPAPPPHPRKPWATADFFRDQMRYRFKMMAKNDHDYDNPELRAFAKNLSIPSQLLFGAKDEIYHQSYAEQFKSVVPSAGIKIIEDGTHDIQNTAPESFVASIKEFAS